MNIYDNKYKFLRDSYEGLGGFNPSSSYSYLVKQSREEDVWFEDRRWNTTLDNLYRPMIDIYLVPVFGANKEINTNNENVKDFIKSTNLITKINKAITNLKINDLSFVGMEWNDGSYEIVNILPEHITEVKYTGDKVTGLEYTIYKEYADTIVPVFCKYDSITDIETGVESFVTAKLTLAWYDDEGNITLEEASGLTRLTVFDEIIESDIVKVGQNGLNETPASFPLGLTNKELYNLESYRKEILTKNTFPIFAISTDDDLKDISLSNNTALKVPSNVSKMPVFIEAAGTSVTLLSEVIKEKKDFVYKMFSNNLISDGVAMTSATSVMLASRNFDAEVDYLYTEYKNLVEYFINGFMEMNDISTTVTYEYEEIKISVEALDKQVNNLLQ